MYGDFGSPSRRDVAVVFTSLSWSLKGSASTFVLLPAALERIFGTEPQLFIAPMRDLLVSLPANVDRGFAGWLHEEFAALDPNCLAPIGFDFRAGRVTLEPLDAPTAVA